MLLLVPLVVWGAVMFVRDDTGPEQPDAQIPTGRAETTQAMLLAGTDGAGGEAEWLVLLFTDPARDRATVIYIPAHTAVEIPGRGLQGIGGALQSGDEDLLVLSTSSLLGIDIDRFAAFDPEEAELLMSLVSPLTVNVPVEVRQPAGDGNELLRFPIGSQELNAGDLVTLLYERGIDGDDVSLGSRHLAFWNALLDRHRGEPEGLGTLIVPGFEAVGEEPEDGLMVASLAGFGSATTTLTILPVRQVGVGGDELYSVDPDEISRFIEDTLGEGVGIEAGVRVRILNGNGHPGIGQEVGELLLGEGYRIVLTGNAPRLDYETTLVVTHTDEADEAAQRALELLGVGEVQVSGQEQGIVDLTIVVGRDFLERGNRSP